MSLKQNIERILILFCEDIKDYEYESSSCIGKDERSSEEFVKIFIESNSTQFNRILALIQNEKDERVEKFIELLNTRPTEPQQVNQGYEWVSVDDRLPEDYNGKSDEYLVVNYGEIKLATWHAYSYNDNVGDSHDGQQFMVPNTDSDYGGMFVARGVTHWMPLPNPPMSETKRVTEHSEGTPPTNTEEGE